MKTPSHNVIRIVRPDETEPDGHGRDASSGHRRTARPGASSAASLRLANTASHPARTEAGPDRRVRIFRSVYLAFMEGFALYGAALHPTAAVPAHVILAAWRDWQPAPEAAEPVQRGDRDGADRNGNVLKFSRVLPPDAPPERSENWLRSTREGLTASLSRFRREREIRRAVAALMKLDDRTLRDLGICCRSEIEWTVRYCRDC
ncbi:MAG: DUF1127 domain-containing protein [Tardiphaga sp.]